MTDEEKDLLAPLTHWITRIEASASHFAQANELRMRLPVEASKQLMNLAEATAGCEYAIQTFASRVEPSKEVLQVIAGHLRTIHHSLDDVVLPAWIQD